MPSEIWPPISMKPFLKRHAAEQGPVIRFLTLKGLKTNDVQTEFEQKCEIGAPVIGECQMVTMFLWGVNRPWR
jgi:hypothetical protein